MSLPNTDFLARLDWAVQRAAGQGRDLTDRGLSLKIGRNRGWMRDLRRLGNIPKADDVAALAEAIGISSAWLMSGQGEPVTNDVGQESVTVEGALQAGVWSDQFDWPPEKQFRISIPARASYIGLKLYGAVIEGPSMDRIYPPGSIVVLRRLIDMEPDLVHGRRYHVERQLPDGRTENTLKTIHIRADKSIWLVPESHDPLYQAPIPAKAAPGEHIAFVGRVVAALTFD